MAAATVLPSQSLSTLGSWGLENLTRIIAIDSQSDESSRDIPSSEGQRTLSVLLEEFFRSLGVDTERDSRANLIAKMPSRIGPSARPLALMAHMDTSEGTMAVPAPQIERSWQGARIPYPSNPALEVTIERFPALSAFSGEDVIFGPGAAPIGLDNKLGLSEIMTLAQVLCANPQIPHGPLFLVFRPDEEIGRMEAVESLAERFLALGIRHGYTVDGIAPFEINTENFNASGAVVRAPSSAARIDASIAATVKGRIHGVTTHGAVAKSEGYLNAIVVLARALEVSPRAVPLSFESDVKHECDGEFEVLLAGEHRDEVEHAYAAFRESLEERLSAHRWAAAGFELSDLVYVDQPFSYDTRASRTFDYIKAFLRRPGCFPKLSEDSEGYQGYTNPYAIVAESIALAVHHRVRAFTELELRQREAELTGLAESHGLSCELKHQYLNMGPALAPFPELVEWAERAASELRLASKRQPIRGGTGVDPFVKRGIGLANLGAGYFAPESSKEITSVQTLAKHVLWLNALVQIAAASRA